MDNITQNRRELLTVLHYWFRDLILAEVRLILGRVDLPSKEQLREMTENDILGTWKRIRPLPVDADLRAHVDGIVDQVGNSDWLQELESMPAREMRKFGYAIGQMHPNVMAYYLPAIIKRVFEAEPDDAIAVLFAIQSHFDFRETDPTVALRVPINRLMIYFTDRPGVSWETRDHAQSVRFRLCHKSQKWLTAQPQRTIKEWTLALMAESGIS